MKSRKEVKNKIEEDEKVEAEERESLGKKALYIYNRKIVSALNRNQGQKKSSILGIRGFLPR